MAGYLRGGSGTQGFRTTANLQRFNYGPRQATTTYVQEVAAGGGGGTITLSGDVTGSGTTSIVAELSDTGVAAGSYTNTNLTVDVDGRIIAASNGSGGVGGGTVTSVAAGTGLTASPSPIVGAGTVSLSVPVSVANGGTGSTTAGGARTNLGTEPTITAGTTSQYWRGDKAWVTLDKAAVGLGNVDNTSDLSKPVSTATQTALNLKADLAGPTFTGDPKAPTPAPGDNDTSIATTAFVGAAITAAPNQTITLSGDIAGSGTAAIATTLPTVNSNVGTFQGLTVNGKGQVTAAANQSYLTGNQTITVTGDVDGSGTTAIALTLDTVNANVGAFTNANITVNGKGLITAAANGTGGSGTITAGTAGEVALYTGATTIDGFAMSGDATISASGVVTLATNSVVTTDITNANVTYGKIQNVAASRLLGNPTGSAAAPSEISLAGTLSFAGTTITGATGMSGMTAGQLPVAATATTVTSSIALPLSAANGGTADTGSAWSTYTPTLTPGSGTYTSASAAGRYKRLGRTCFLSIQVAITTNGTAAGSVNVSLPAGVTASTGSLSILAGRETSVNGLAMTGTISSGATTVQIMRYDNIYPGANGVTLVVTGLFESST